MPNKKIQENLYSYCRWNDTEEVINILRTENDVDVLYENGRLFDFALSENNKLIMIELLTYFKEKQLSKYEIGSDEYNDLYNQFTEILENAADGIELSKEMKEVLAPYIDFEDSIDERLNDSFLESITIPFENETFNSSEEERGLVGNNEPITNHNSEVISH